MILLNDGPSMHDLSDVFGFSVDTKKVLKHLNADMFDEWYYDCLHYHDLINAKSEIIETVRKQVGVGKGRYPSQSRTVRNIPKKGLPVRYSLETDFYDRFVYQAICSFLIQYFDPLLSHRVLSHRLATNNKKYLFQNRIERWFTYEGVTYTFMGEKKSLLVTDLANYYENIRTKDIIEAFEELLPSVEAGPEAKQQIRNALSLLEACLDRWSLHDGFGLAQNRDASAFMANVLLFRVDRAMEAAGYDYFRYVDDIRIVCESEDHAKKGLLDLIGNLRKIGLNVNSAKTTILNHNSSVEDISKEFPTKDPRVVAIEQMWKSRSRAIILRSIKYLILLLVDCIENNQTQSRSFRFAANRLAQLSDQGLLTPDQFDTNLPEILVEAMFKEPVSTDQYCKMLKLLGLDTKCVEMIEKFLTDRQRAIHDWQNYHLWMMLARNAVKSSKLRACAIEVLKTKMESAEAGSILIWADQVGYKSVVNIAITRFSADTPFQFQRYFAIATRRYPSQKLVNIYNQISGRVRGTKDRCLEYETESGRLEFPTRGVAIQDLFDEVSEYD